MNLIHIYILLILILIAILIYIIYYSKSNEINEINEINEKFITNNNTPENDGKMKFNYVNNPNYTKTILSRYYLNDDSQWKIGDISGRYVYHPYQYKRNPYWLNSSKYYGFLWHNPQLSDSLFNSYGVRL